MILLMILTVTIALGVGAAAKWATRNDTEFNITHNEFVVAAVIITLLVVPLTLRTGYAIAKGNALKFHEYWNGWEKAALMSEERCSRDSGCHYTYDCDPYTVFHTHTRSSADGKSVETYTETHTEYHSCPYGTREQTWRIDTTLGTFDLGVTIPEGSLGFRGRGIPGSIPRGVPALWQACKDRLAANDPGGVTKRMTYDNYILASDQTILKQYSDGIADLKRQRLLPPVPHKVQPPYLANKVQFVGMTAPPGEWQLALSRLNAALGVERQGDLHMVVLDAGFGLGDVLKPDAYITALKAYWTDTKLWKRDSISKNTIIVVVSVGRDGKVAWARATTGMPVGNEAMAVAIKERLVGVALTPEEVVGKVTRAGEKSSTVTGGVAAVVLGEPGFERVSMTAEDKNDLGTGFKYLGATLQPSGVAKFVMVLVALVFSTIAWVVCLAYTSSRRQ